MADEVEALLRKYTAELRAVISRQLEAQVTEAVRRAFKGSVPVAGKRPAGRPAKTDRRSGSTVRGGKANASARPANAVGGRRSPAKIASQTKRLLTYIKGNPGQRSEQISEATKISTSDLALPIKKLLAEKKIKSSGVARGTTYSPAA